MELGKYKGKTVSAFTNSISANKDALQSVASVYNADCKNLIADNLVATWDTGATCCVIDINLANKIGLTPISQTYMNTVGGLVPSNIYNLSLKLPNNVLVPNILIYSGSVFGGSLLIGMNVIKLGDFSVTSYQNNTIFTFRMPSLESIDYVKEINTSNIVNKRQQVPLKAPCPCNSGRQFKDCCGRRR